MKTDENFLVKIEEKTIKLIFWFPVKFCVV